MEVTIFGWIAAGLCAIGSLMNIYKSKWGFVVWIVSNIILLTISAVTKQYYFMFIYCLYTVECVYGYFKWSKL